MKMEEQKMGTNYYFRKKSIDAARIKAIADSLNKDIKTLIEKYNKELHEAFSSMKIDSGYEFEDNYSFYLPDSRETYGDIHVGKL